VERARTKSTSIINVCVFENERIYVGKPNKQHLIKDIAIVSLNGSTWPCGETGTVEHKPQKLLDVGKGST
jgi:hypothetical protein